MTAVALIMTGVALIAARIAAEWETATQPHAPEGEPMPDETEEVGAK